MTSRNATVSRCHFGHSFPTSKSHLPAANALPCTSQKSKMDGFAPLAPAMKALAGSSGSRMSSEEHERLERLRRCASCVSFESADGSDEGTEEWAFTPGPAAKARLIESKAGGVWALARRADGTVFFGTQAGEVRAWAPGTEGEPWSFLGQPVAARAPRAAALPIQTYVWRE